MKHFNRSRFIDLKRMEADLLNKAAGATYRAPVSHKADDREVSSVLEYVGAPCVKGETLTAYGARIARKGGVHSGGVFVSGEVARGRGAVFVTVGGTRLYDAQGRRVITANEVME